jgi:hypothetical protein
VDSYGGKRLRERKYVFLFCGKERRKKSQNKVNRKKFFENAAKTKYLKGAPTSDNRRY